MRLRLEIQEYLQKEELVIIQNYLKKNFNEPIANCPTLPPKDILVFFEKVLS